MKNARLTVEYSGGLDPELDTHLDAIAGGEQAGSGYCFIDSMRDVGWLFNDRQAAEISATRLAEIERIKKVTLIIYNEEGETVEEKEYKND